MPPRRAVLLAASLLALVCPASAMPPGAPAKFFEDKVRPLLVEKCHKCHGTEKQRGGLRLDSRAAILKGGESGPAIVAGKPDESLLILAVRHGESLKMPPMNKLPAADIAVLTAWVQAGAAWPDAVPVAPTPTSTSAGFTRQQGEFWAFQPPRSADPPAVKDTAWVKSPLDRFILARLEAAGLKPAPIADKRTLVRRVTFDLTGLPPTPDEVKAFLEDDSAGAFDRLVDRLLASPHYGERWGRHWLDVARYADSNGMDENLAQGNAWRYRDCVIGSFNRDKPYDAFVREQIAGDLLPPPGANTPASPTERLIATSFLCIGPKMLAEDDPVKMQMDIIDEQIDTIGRTFLGLTLGCARCHDHKFDPISQQDYYGLAGIFKSTQTMDNFRVVARWHERPLATSEAIAARDAHERRLAEKKSAADQMFRTAAEKLVSDARSRTEDYLAAAQDYLRRRAAASAIKPLMTAESKPAGALVLEAEDFARGNVKKDHTTYGEKIGVIYNAGPLPNFAEYDVILANAATYQLELRYAAAEARPVKVFLDGKLLRSDAAGHVTGSWYPDRQAWAVETALDLSAGKHVLRLERAQPFPHFDKLALVPLDEKAAATAPRSAEQIARERALQPVFLLRWVQALERLGKPLMDADRKRLLEDRAGPFAVVPELETELPAATLPDLKKLRDEVTALEKTRPELPHAMAVAEGKGENVRIHLRGNHLTLGTEAPRQFPRILAGEKQTPITGSQSGRLELAEWMTRPDHPLTARVMVNRVWHWHFGAGLVRSTDNLGNLGERPSHPELLDWLAVEFVKNGWSVKHLHRLILRSATYQMSTAYDATAARLDPDNRLHWRTDRRRLEAEALRDALLAVSGRLDRAMGGSLFKGANRAYVPGYPNSRYDGYDSERRSVYLPVIRSDGYDVFQAFDFPDPSVPNGERAVTTVAPQALFLMNGKVVHEQTGHLARRLLGRADVDDAGRARWVYELAYGRPASAAETERALRFVRTMEATPEWAADSLGQRRERAWQSLCRVLVSASEFSYVE